MDSLELTTFKKIYNGLSLECKKVFTKEMNFSIYSNLVKNNDESNELNDAIFTLIKNNDQIFNSYYI